ncbi:hypothetical protein MTO96_010688 [Rhipicephalus appendiculatus]
MLSYESHGHMTCIIKAEKERRAAPANFGREALHDRSSGASSRDPSSNTDGFRVPDPVGGSRCARSTASGPLLRTPSSRLGGGALGERAALDGSATLAVTVAVGLLLGHGSAFDDPAMMMRMRN